MPERRSARDLERKARRSSDALLALLQPSGIQRRGSVIADLLYRAQHASVPDGFPTSSAAAAPALLRPAAQDRLRTDPEDALRRKREAGYAESSSVEAAVESLMEDVCDDCGGAGEHVLGTTGREGPCKSCGGTGRRYHDPISEAVDELVAALETVVRCCHKIDKKRQIVLHARDSAPTAVDAVSCLGCHRKVYGGKADPIRRGLCNSCATAYYLWRSTSGTDDESADRHRWRVEVGPERRHEGHDEALCDQCAEDRRKAGDEWKLDRQPVDHSFERLDELQRRGELPTRRGAA